jgi:magnesium-transporting ATPase (P-type)
MKGKFFDGRLFIENVKDDVIILLSLISAVLVYLAPFMGWLVKKSGDETIKGSLFDIAGKSSTLALNQGRMAASGIVLMAVAIMMALFSLRESIRPLKPLADKFILWLVPGILGVVMYFVVVKNLHYASALKSDSVSSGNGNVACMVGVVLYIITVIVEKINHSE